MSDSGNRKDELENIVADSLAAIRQLQVTPLDLLPHARLSEKLIELVVNGEPHHENQEVARLFGGLLDSLERYRVDRTRVVVFGGGTGLSNIIGGDCRSVDWARAPFSGLKEVFPRTRSVVCVTDDGGSTGEMLKDLPLVAIGDIRHVLLSSIQLAVLQRTYQVSVSKAHVIAAELARLFNYRFSRTPATVRDLLDRSGAALDVIPRGLAEILRDLVGRVFTDTRLAYTLQRPQCLGNLIVAAAIYRFLDPEVTTEELTQNPELLHDAIFSGLQYLALALGTGSRAVMPCTTTPSQLRLVYSNGVMTTGESKTSAMRRGVPVESAHVDFCGEPLVHPEIINDIEQADILILAPGSLYSSIIPVFKVPGLADAVRRNSRALKILVSNLWVQAGETDLSISDPERKFRVSDMIRAYERNIPGGVRGLFDEVLCLSLKDVPASVIQNYAVEGKIPIYLDREVVSGMGFSPVECGIYSKKALAARGVIQHDSEMLSTAVKVLYSCYRCVPSTQAEAPVPEEKVLCAEFPARRRILPNLKHRLIHDRVEALAIDCHHCPKGCYGGLEDIRDRICELIWKHHDIPLSHLDFIERVECVDQKCWRRDQQWDNVFSFYDPEDRSIKIRQDQFGVVDRLEVAMLIAIGESLLGDYAAEKIVKDVVLEGQYLGKVYHLFLRPQDERHCYFSDGDLGAFLKLARMGELEPGRHFARLINGDEGFTPPGLLMGLTYAWYLENRFATHIEYKMTVMKIPQTDLIPEQKRMASRRERTVSFFRDVVFRDEKAKE